MFVVDGGCGESKYKNDSSKERERRHRPCVIKQKLNISRHGMCKRSDQLNRLVPGLFSVMK